MDGKEIKKDPEKWPTISWEASILSSQNENLYNINNILKMKCTS